MNSFVGKDVYLQNLSAEGGELNNLGARCLKYYPDKERYSVRTHLTGRILLVKPNCIIEPVLKRTKTRTADGRYLITELLANPNIKDEDRKSKSKITCLDNDQQFDAVIGQTRCNLEYRKILSERVREGIMKKREKGALVVNLLDVKKTKPTFVMNAHDLIVNEKQCVFMTDSEMKQKFGKAYIHGRQILSKRMVYTPGMNWPDMVKASGLFAHLLPLTEWDDGMYNPSSLQPRHFQKAIFEEFGVDMRLFIRTIESHFQRRYHCSLNEPPFEPATEIEWCVMSILKSRFEYDGYLETFKKNNMHELDRKRLNQLKPLGSILNAPLWKDHKQMDGYSVAFSFIVFCFVPVSHADEAMAIRNQTDDMFMYHRNEIVDGWKVVGFESIGFWSKFVEKKMKSAEQQQPNMSELEKLHLFDKNGPNCPLTGIPLNHERDSKLNTWVNYKKGGDFRKNLSSSYVQQHIDCSNPSCDKTEFKFKDGETGKVFEKSAEKMLKCSRCLKAYYWYVH